MTEIVTTDRTETVPFRGLFEPNEVWEGDRSCTFVPQANDAVARVLDLPSTTGASMLFGEGLDLYRPETRGCPTPCTSMQSDSGVNYKKQLDQRLLSPEQQGTQWLEAHEFENAAAQRLFEFEKKKNHIVDIK